jgi:cytochrome c
MSKRFVLVAVLLLGVAFTALSATTAPAQAAKPEKANAQEAEAMVKKGVAYIKANGRDKALAEINSGQGQFIDRDLYLSVIRLDGTSLAHGANKRLVGKNMIDMKDVDGREFVRERMQLAKTKGSFWQDYKFVNPITRKVEPKTMYCQRLDDFVVCGGIYKPV